jgi:hypothetical protein
MQGMHCMPLDFPETFSFIENTKLPLKSDLNSYAKHTLQAYLTEVPTCGVTVFSALNNIPCQEKLTCGVVQAQCEFMGCSEISRLGSLFQ